MLRLLIVETCEKRFVPVAVPPNVVYNKIVGGWSLGKIILRKHDASVGRFTWKPTVREESSPTVVIKSPLFSVGEVIAANYDT